LCAAELDGNQYRLDEMLSRVAVACRPVLCRAGTAAPAVRSFSLNHIGAPTTVASHFCQPIRSAPFSTADDSPKDTENEHIRQKVFEDFMPPKEPVSVGRPWGMVELRGKSFDDLHKLWYVLLKERNALETERLLGMAKGVRMVNPQRRKKVRLSMARIKVTLGERTRAHKAEVAAAKAAEDEANGVVVVNPQDSWDERFGPAFKFMNKKQQLAHRSKLAKADHRKKRAMVARAGRAAVAARAN
jgi:large subunit ribosomal protein L47